MNTVLVDIYHSGSGMRVISTIPEPVVQLDDTHRLVGRYNNSMDEVNFLIETTGTEILGKKLEGSNIEISKFSMDLDLNDKVEPTYRLRHGPYQIKWSCSWEDIEAKIIEYWKEGYK